MDFAKYWVGGSAASYQIDRSLRFNDDDSAYLSKVFASAGNRKKWTWSGWAKRSTANNTTGLLFYAETSASAYTQIGWSGDNFQLNIAYSGTSFAYIRAAAESRDVSAWAHYVVVYDSENATSTDRMILYINGTRVTSFAISSFPSQDALSPLNANTTHYIGTRKNVNQYYDGYLTDVYFIDGQALAPTAFGEYDDNNVWQPKEYKGAYGGYNQSQTWSTACTLTLESGVSVASGTIADLFNNTSSYFYTSSSGTGPGITHRITFPSGVRGSKVRIKNVYDDGSAQALNSNNVNDLVSNTGSNPGGWSTIYDGVETDINYISFGAYTGTVDNVANYIEIDGQLLVDAGISVVDNSFHLDFSDNSSNAALGDDSSGNSNNWTVNNIIATGVTYSNDLTASGTGFSLSSAAADAFDGDLTDSAYGPSGGSLTWAPSPAIAYSTSVEVYPYQSPGDTASLNGGAAVSLTAGQWNTVATGSGTITSLVVSDATNKPSIAGIRVDGTILVDSAPANTDSLEDTPTNNWCTINPLDGPTSTTLTYSQGNLTSESASSSARNMVTGTIGVTSGKWYWELTVDSGDRCIVGVALTDATRHDYLGVDDSGWSIYQLNGDKYHNATGTSYGSAWTTAGDVLQIALDADNGKIWFGKNGTYFDSGNPAAGTNAAYTNVTGGALFPAIGDGSQTGVYKATYNFGQRAFAYTPPTDFKALNTANLPVPTIEDGTKYFKTVLYAGNGSTQTITGLNFSPDLLWIKNRSAAFSHVLFDKLRVSDGSNGDVNGASKELYSDLTNAQSNLGYVTLTNDGFTLGVADSSWNASNNYVAWAWDAGSNSSKTFTVKVVSDSGNKYRFDDFGTSAVTLDLEEGSTYVFDQSDSSNSGHPLRFSTTSDGTHGSGSEYTTGVTTTGTPGTSGAKTTIVVAASAPTLYYYCSAHSGMGGQANTNIAAGASNFAGSIQSTVRANAQAGFSIVKYTGNSTAGASVGHNLGIAPKVIFTKTSSTGLGNWGVYHYGVDATSPEDYMLNLNLGNGRTDSALWWNDTAPTNTVFTIGTSNDVNGSSDYIAYCFAEVEGYSKFGSYEGNGSSNGKFIALPFKPAFFLLKDVDRSSTRWIIMDNARDPHNVAYHVLSPSGSQAEDTSTSYWLADFVSNGVKLRYGADNEFNRSGDTYIYMAFAEHPFKTARAR